MLPRGQPKLTAAECKSQPIDHLLELSGTLEDFGSGHHSLLALADAPLNRVKLDMRYVPDVATNRRSRAIADSLISIAHAYGWEAVAEHFETKAEAEFLQREGSDAMQGSTSARRCRRGGWTRGCAGVGAWRRRSDRCRTGDAELARHAYFRATRNRRPHDVATA